MSLVVTLATRNGSLLAPENQPANLRTSLDHRPATVGREVMAVKVGPK